MNKIKPIPNPEVPKDFLSAMSQQFQNNELLVKNLGMLWLRSSRTSMNKHISLISWIKIAVFLQKNRQALIEKTKLLSQ